LSRPKYWWWCHWWEHTVFVRYPQKKHPYGRSPSLPQGFFLAIWKHQSKRNGGITLSPFIDQALFKNHFGTDENGQSLHCEELHLIVFVQLLHASSLSCQQRTCCLWTMVDDSFVYQWNPVLYLNVNMHQRVGVP
jgi:hypothetical protein